MSSWSDYGVVMLGTTVVIVGLGGLGALVGLVIARLRYRRFMKVFNASINALGV